MPPSEYEARFEQQRRRRQRLKELERENRELFLMGFKGDKARWRTMPWMVTLFGILVVAARRRQRHADHPAAGRCRRVVHAGLIAAAAMLVMIPLTLDEVVATVQFLVQARREGQPFWQTFWLGGALREGTDAANGPVRADVVSQMAMLWGVALPWNLIVTVALGFWLMAAPSAFGSMAWQPTVTTSSAR